MKKTLEVKFLITLTILIGVDILDGIIKSDFSMTTLISSLLMRGSTLLLAWILVKYFK